MAELLFGPHADDFLTELEADRSRVELLGRLNAALDRLESDPGDVWCRRRRYQNLGVWGIVIEAEGVVWLILWEQAEDGRVIVQSITPAP